MIKKMFCSCLSQRRIALILGINRKTVSRKLKLLGIIAKQNHFIRLKGMETVDQVQFDDLETIEHTKCKPVSLSLAVEKDSRRILGFRLSKMPAKGHLARIARRKYGYRADQRPTSLDQLFKELTECVSPLASFQSDSHPFYPTALNKHFPHATHQTSSRKPPTVAGQGELKKTFYDPLFSINHTFAMLRANISRLIRKTWNTTKSIKMLEHHLWIYIEFHNEFLIHNLAK
jgi:hypothetical protein